MAGPRGDAGPRGTGAHDGCRGAGRLLVLGASARALAVSAARSIETKRRFPAGILAIDYFGDTDLCVEARRSAHGRGEASDRSMTEVAVVSVRRDLGLPRTTTSLGRAALVGEWSSLAYTGGLENRPGLLRLLERRQAADGPRTVLGNDAKTLAAVRDPRRLFPFLQAQGIPHAAVRFDNAIATGPALAGAASWLIKTMRSAGGAGVRESIVGAPLPRGCFFQERLRGPIGSAAFLADGKEAVLLGISEQLSGWEALGASGFRYAGNIAGPWSAFLSPGALEQVGRTVRRITERFGLRGLNGFDYVLCGGVPSLIEVNPRWTASMELIEERTGRNLFDLHLRTSEGDRIAEDRPWPEPEWDARASSGRLLAKGVLYARDACTAPDPAALEELGARDRPARGERIAPGQPICTLLVEGGDPGACRVRLKEMAATVRSLLKPA